MLTTLLLALFAFGCVAVGFLLHRLLDPSTHTFSSARGVITFPLDRVDRAALEDAMSSPGPLMDSAWASPTFSTIRRSSLEDASPALIEGLRQLGDNYGPLGVAIAAAHLTDPNVLVHDLLAGRPIPRYADSDRPSLYDQDADE